MKANEPRSDASSVRSDPTRPGQERKPARPSDGAAPTAPAFRNAPETNEPDLDLAIEPIQLSENLKEGFTGQER